MPDPPLKLAAAITAALLMTGCMRAPDSISTDVDCESTGGYSHQEGFSYESNCEVSVRFIWNLNNGSVQQIDLQSSTIDISSSTIDVLATVGTGVVSVKTGTGSLHTATFEWEKVNDELILSDINALENWLAQYNNSIQEMEIDIADIYAAQIEGTNTFTAEAEYNDVVQSGDSVSWYQAPSNCEGLYPNEQLCF